MLRYRLPSLLLAAVAAAACAPDSPTAPLVPRTSADRAGPGGKTFVIVGVTDSLDPAIARQLAAAGGTVTRVLPAAGLAVATSNDPAFQARASAIPGVASVAADTLVQWVDPNQPVRELDSSVAPPAGGSGTGSAETFYGYQWAVRAISAPAAWDAGALGAGARVAVLDGGIYDAHIDIAPNLDAGRSVSFVPGTTFNQDVGTFWHGTHVAGIVASAANRRGTIGVAPSATLVGVKVLHNGSGAFSWVISGIYYAATPIERGGGGADVINMSLGAVIPSKGKDVRELIRALDHATRYAGRQGVTVIAAAGNSAYDMDTMKDSVEVPAQSQGVIAVSATGPTGFIQGATNFDRFASYSNYGKRLVTFAAPGGDFADAAGYPFDMVLAPCRGLNPASIGSYCFAAGTSMAAPAVSGVAALVIGKAGGRLSPARVESALRRGADDLGKPGRDEYYGQGRINAAGAIQ